MCLREFVKNMSVLQWMVVGILIQPRAMLILEDSQVSTTEEMAAIIAEVKQLRMQLNTQAADMATRLRAVESFQQECGCEGKPTKYPAFMAALSADLVHCTHLQPVIFDAVKTNVGTAYNSMHGIFTAPVTGTYLFTSTLTVEPNQAFHTAIVRNNATNEIAYLYADPSSIWLERSTTIVSHLQANDEVWMVCLSDSFIDGDKNHAWDGANDFHSHFSGFLISAD